MPKPSLDRPACALPAVLAALALTTACESPAPVAEDPWAALTPYQRTAITMCNHAATRIRSYHRLAERSASESMYDKLAEPLVRETIENNLGEQRASTFRDFLDEFAAREAVFVWENRRLGASALDRAHLDWCRRQDEWVSSYR